MCEQGAQLEHGDIVIVQRELTPSQAAAARFPSPTQFMTEARARTAAAAAAAALEAGQH
jgi:hypothetical protein